MSWQKKWLVHCLKECLDSDCPKLRFDTLKKSMAQLFYDGLMSYDDYFNLTFIVELFEK